MTVVVRTSKGLVDALFDTIDALNDKKITAEEARAISHSAKTIVGIARLELDYRQLASGSDGLKSLTIDPDHARQPA